MGKRDKRKKRQRQAGSRRKGIPEEFLERIDEMFDPFLVEKVKKSFVTKPTTFRVNRIKATKEEILEVLKREGFKVKLVPWYSDAFILLNRKKRELTALDIYEEGKIYIQSLASMVPPVILDPQPGERVLDLTAAPGSKTSQMAMMMDKTGVLTANDNNKVRFFRLKHNMEHLGVVDDEALGWEFTLTQRHGVQLGIDEELAESFDRILLDAPCSAESRFVADDYKTFAYWSARKIKETSYKQRKLLFAAWKALKPGGRLVYSTCTFAPEENEVLIAKFLERIGDEAKVVPVELEGLERGPIMKEWKEVALGDAVQKTLRIMPSGEIEGFYVACLDKVVE